MGKSSMEDHEDEEEPDYVILEYLYARNTE